MTKPNFRQRCLRAVMLLVVGGSAFQVGGCDPNVRSALLNTFEGTSQGIVSAFFLNLQNGVGGDGLTTAQ